MVSDGPGLLKPFTNPESIAIVGVSSSGRGVGATTLSTIRRFGFEGELAVVHPSVDQINGVAAYPSLDTIPFPVELVVMCANAETTIAAVSDSIAIGAKAGVLFASGFSEVGGIGYGLQRQLSELLRGSGFRVLGPNCQGVVAYQGRLAVTFSNPVRSAQDLLPSPVAYIGQSGAIGGSVFDLGREIGVVPALWVSTGNQVDLDVVAVALDACRSTDLSLLIIYLEEIPSGDSWEELVRTARDVGKRIVVLRSGTTAAGRVAVASHTGALVGAASAFEALCDDYDVITTKGLGELMDVVGAHQSGFAGQGRQVAIVSTSGGAGGLAADQASRAGLEVARLTTQTREQLRQILPSFASIQNPLDITAGLVSRTPERLGDVCRLVAADPGVDQVVVVISAVIGHLADVMAGSIVDAARELPCPIAVIYLASHERTASTRAIFRDGDVRVFDRIESALAATGLLARRISVVDSVVREGDALSHAGNAVTMLTEGSAADLLDTVGVRRPRSMLATSRVDAEKGARELGSAVFAVKIQSADITHKSDVGGVIVGVALDAVGDAFDLVSAAVGTNAPEAKIDGVLVQELVEPGVELLVSLQSQDNGYRPLLTVGMGGLYAELYSDVVSTCLPVGREDVDSMLRGLHWWPLLDGGRGTIKCDTAAAIGAILGVAKLYDVLGDRLVEVEINPLIVHEIGGGTTAVDFVGALRASGDL